MLIQDGALGLTSLGRVASVSGIAARVPEHPSCAFAPVLSLTRGCARHARTAGGRPHCAGECGPQCPGLDELLRGAQDEAPARHAGGGRR